MGKGISNRMHLNLPKARRALDVAGIESRLDESLRVIDRWANSLPFAAHGFHFRRTVSEGATPNGAPQTITWTTVVEDRDKWMPIAGTVQSIVVPRESSGLYMLRLSIYWATTVAGLVPWIRRNGAALTSSDMFTVATDRDTLVTVATLEDGDVLTAGWTNLSGAARTITAAPGTDLGNPYPEFQAWRIALLG